MFLKQSIYKILLISCLTILITGCSQIELASHYTKKAMSPWAKNSKSIGRYKVGSSYKIAGKRYYPKEDFNLVQTGIASWYGPGFHGKKTANGEIYNQYAMTAAHKTLQLPAVARVTNLENGRSVIVRINDRGPYENGRIIDLSKSAAKRLGVIKKGTARIRLQVLPKESRQVADAAKRGKDTSKIRYTDTNPQRKRVRLRQKQKIHQQAYLTNDARMDYVPMGRVKNSYLPESLRRPVITTRQVQMDVNNNGRNIDLPNWDGSEYAVRPVAKKKIYTPAVSYNAQTDEAGVYVQAGAFSIYDNANRLSKRLSQIAPVHIREIQVQNRRLYRVRLGPVKTIKEARVVEQNIRNAGYNDPMHIVIK